MNILFYHTSALLSHHMGVLMDEAEIYSRQGHNVYFAICDGFIDMCFINPMRSKSRCKYCKSVTRKALKLFSPNINVIKLSELKTTFKLNSFDYTTIDDIKKIKYKNVDVGFAALSTYISFTRNNNPCIDEIFKTYFQHIISLTCFLTDSLELLIDNIKPDIVCLFNGRLYENKPLYDLAMSKNIHVKSYEVIGGYGEPYYKICFNNMMPHNILGNKKMCEDLWDNVKLDLEEKYRIGRSFYENRRNGKPSCDKVYINNQVIGCLPLDWNKAKKNIVIFNSSEDEFSSIGDEFDKLALFSSQLDGIKKILEITRNDKEIHFYLRIHPNLSSVEYKYHTDLYELSNVYENITIIPAKDKVSTYDLMDNADQIIVFGSTTGLEAAYWGKPVILLAGSLYYYSNLVYKPQSINELYEMMKSTLSPKYDEFAIKFGFYYMYIYTKKKYKKIDFNWENFRIFNRNFLNIHYLKLLGSSKLYSIYKAILKRFVYNIKKDLLITIPIKEKE